jgi:uncharacterized membrane protein YkvA (DUF1232 family)
MNLKAWARSLRRDAHAVWLAARDPRTPWCAKALAFAVAGYALSPIDLIPDFIPVLGYLDDLILVPVGLWLVLKMIPREVLAAHRASAEAAADRPVSRAAATAVVGVWIAVALIGGLALIRALG